MKEIDYDVVRQSLKILDKLEKLIKSEGVSGHELLICAMRQGFLPPITREK